MRVALSGVELGCDLEMIEPRSDAFVADYFTAEEQALVARASAADRSRAPGAALERERERAQSVARGPSTRHAERDREPRRCGIRSHGWSPLRVRHADGRIFCGWWQHADGIVRTVVAASAAGPADSLARSDLRSRRCFPVRVEAGDWHDCPHTFQRARCGTDCAALPS